METVEKRAGPPVGERLSGLDERLRALQAGLDRMLDGQARVARTVTEQATAHAVLAQWVKDWTAEVMAWRDAVDARMDRTEAAQEEMQREAAHVRGAVRVALWVLGTFLTVATGVFTSLLVKLASRLGGP